VVIEIKFDRILANIESLKFVDAVTIEWVQLRLDFSFRDFSEEEQMQIMDRMAAYPRMLTRLITSHKSKFGTFSVAVQKRMLDSLESRGLVFAQNFSDGLLEEENASYDESIRNRLSDLSTANIYPRELKGRSVS
jgi:hypothetical protein